MNGLLLIDKPAGITSHDVVARCRRILKTKKIGHTGTLDPFATGVVVILIGRATRLAQFLDKDEKEYRAVMCFGFETDTGDLTGKRLASGAAAMPSEDAIDTAMSGLTGVILQTPPMFSAKKINGKKLYEFARKGLEIERSPTRVTIHRLERLADDAVSAGEVSFRTICSAGTYVRTLAVDVARAAGSAAHLVALRRTRAGRFRIGDALTIEELERVVAEDGLGGHLISMNEAVSHLPAIALDAERAAKTKSGLSTRLVTESAAEGDPFRMIDEKGELIAIGAYDMAGKSVQPRIVLV